MMLKLKTPDQQEQQKKRKTTMSKITIRIVDSMSGLRAADVEIETRKIVEGDWALISQSETDKNGCAEIADAADVEGGGYFEVLLFLGAYFNKMSYPLPAFKFVDIVPLRFGVEPDQDDCEIVVAMSPHGYTLVRT